MNSQEKLASRRLGLEKRVSSPSFSVEISLFASAVGASLPMTRIGWETPRFEKKNGATYAFVQRRGTSLLAFERELGTMEC